MQGRSNETAAYWRNSTLKGVGYDGGRQIRPRSWILKVPRGFGRADSAGKGFQENLLSFRYIRPVPQTDTGSQGENPEALEWIMAKELGKIDP